MINMIDQIESKIDELLKDFKQYPDKYLTESDVRCALVSELMKIPDLNQLQDTEDRSKSIPIHTEVRWYGQSGKLKWRSDIVVLDVSTLKVRNSLFRLPSKGYGFNKPKAIIEIKLRRINGESDNQLISKVQGDINKLQNIKDEIGGEYLCYLIVLDKRKSIQRKIPDVDTIKMYYGRSSGRIN